MSENAKNFKYFSENRYGGTLTSIAIFAARETTETLLVTIERALSAAPHNSIVDVLVNGNLNLANSIAVYLRMKQSELQSSSLRIWSIAAGDKAHAWNQHIHFIWPGSGAALYIDGYVRLHPDAINLLLNRMKLSPLALGGTGVPTTGRSSSKVRNELLNEGGFHGNLCCLGEKALNTFKSRGIKLPLGIYRTDSTIGAILGFGMDPAIHSWSLKKFIIVEPNANWETDKKHWWKISDIKASIKRILRQAQGNLENHAVRNHLAVRKLAPENFPTTATELVEEWIFRCPDEAKQAFGQNLIAQYALIQLRKKQIIGDVKISPELIYQSIKIENFS